MKKPEIKAALIHVLEREMDAPLAEQDFHRSPKGLCYTRHNGEATLKLAMEFHSNPSYASGQIAHLVPALQISNTSITALSLSLVEDPMLLANAPEIIQNHHLTMLHRPQMPAWYAGDIAGLDAAVAGILQIFLREGIPFLDDYSTPVGIIRQHERNDTRALIQQHYYVYVIAAYLLVGRPHDAMATLQQQFSRPGIRKRYDSLWKNVTARSSIAPP